MTSGKIEPYLKYALFCRDTEEGPKGELVLKDIVDLIDLPLPQEPPEEGLPVIAEVDLNLAFCIGGASPGKHHLMVAIKGPGIPLEPPPTQSIDWEEGILSSDGSRLFAYRCNDLGCTWPPSCWTALPWGRPAS